MNIDYKAASSFLEQFPLSRLQRLRILAFANTIAAGKEEAVKDGLQSPVRRYVGSSRLSEYFRDYQTFLALLDGCAAPDGRRLVWMAEDCTNHKPRVFEVDRSFVLPGLRTIQIPKADKEQFEAVWRKRVKAGQKCSSDLPVRIAVDFSTYASMLREHRENRSIADNEPFSEDVFQDELRTTWEVISKVNETGSINPSREYRGRCYSDITTLPKFVDSLVTIDGKATGHIDQHATYFTFLPVILGRYKGQDGAYHAEVAQLRRFIVEAVEGPHKGIYGAIAAGCSSRSIVTASQIKGEVLAWICNPEAGKARYAAVSMWFRGRFPRLWCVLNRLRAYNRVSGDMMELEASIFLEASRRLKAEGVHCVTKHDALIFTVDHAERAEAVLREHFTRAGVVFTGKKWMPESAPIRTSFAPISQNENREIEPESPLASVFVHYCSCAPRLPPSPVVAKNDAIGGLSVQSRRRKASIIIRGDGRMQVSWKNRKYNSKKGESEGDFRKRLAALDIFPA